MTFCQEKSAKSQKILTFCWLLLTKSCFFWLYLTFFFTGVIPHTVQWGTSTTAQALRPWLHKGRGGTPNIGKFSPSHARTHPCSLSAMKGKALNKRKSGKVKKKWLLVNKSQQKVNLCATLPCSLRPGDTVRDVQGAGSWKGRTHREKKLACELVY